ncbi:MAG: macro domain-containing protein [Planctomycetota bacterium]
MSPLEKSAKLLIVQDDLLEVDVQAVINPTNTDLLLGAGVAGEIRKRAGPEIQEECLEIGSIGIGQAAVTSGGGLRAAHIIHAATMKIGGVTTEQNLRNAIESIARRVTELKLVSLAFPPMGGGVGRFPMRRAAEVQIEMILREIVNRKTIERVLIAIPDAETRSLFEETYARLTDGAADGAGAEVPDSAPMGI